MICLYVKLSNQLVACSRRNLTKGGKLWDQNPQSCVDNMNEVCKMYDTYLEQYEVVSQKNMLSADKEQDGIELDETVVFGKIELFIKRVEKCIEIFTTVGQFTSVAKNAIEGMDQMVREHPQFINEKNQSCNDLLAEFGIPSNLLNNRLQISGSQVVRS